MIKTIYDRPKNPVTMPHVETGDTHRIPCYNG